MLRDPWLRALAGLAVAIAGIYLVGLVWQVVQEFADIILLFFLAWLLAFVLEPLVLALIEVVHLPRLGAIGLTYLSLLFVLSAAVIVVVPTLTLQLVEIAGNLPTYSDRFVNAVTDLQATANTWLLDHGSPLVLDVKSALNAQELTRRVDALGPAILSNALGFAAGAAALLLNLVIVLILSFYFMADGARLADRLIAALPLRAQDDARFLVANIHRAFAGFLRGQVIQALVGALGTSVLMSVLHVDFALLSSLVAGLVLFIPFLGPIIAVILPVTIAVFTHSEVALILFVSLLALQQVIFNVLAPRILSHQVGLHPLLVFLAILTGARVAGIWGAIFGVPFVAVLVTMVSFYRASQEERVARLQAHLPGQELVSVEMAGDADADGDEKLVSAGKGTA